MYTDLTQKQTDVLFYIKDTILKQGYPPTVRDICSALNIKSTSTVHSYLTILDKLGYIRKDASKTRAIEIINTEQPVENQRKNTVDIPIVGRVAAGIPILATENIEDTFPLPSNFVNIDENYMLKISGDSMIEVGIFDNDYVIVKKQNFAHNGDIVVALINEEATVKTFYKEFNRIRLQPENNLYSPIFVEDITILGKVIGLFRYI